MRDQRFIDDLREDEYVIDRTEILSVAEDALETLFTEGMSPKELLRRTGNTEFGADLIEKVASLFRGTPRWEEFERALHRLAHELLEDASEDEDRVIVALLSETMINPGRILLEDLGPHAYWTLRIGWYVRKGDWRRAWDELGKARRANSNRARYMTLERTATDLYRAMHAQALFGEGRPPAGEVGDTNLLGSYRAPEKEDDTMITEMLRYFHAWKTASRQKKTREALTASLRA